MSIAYLDNAATTRIHPQIQEILQRDGQEYYANPSSLHSAGRAAKRRIEDSRERIAECLGADPKEILFTSCATESNNLAIVGVCEALATRGNHIVTSSVEHPAVRETCDRLRVRGFEVTRVPVNADGCVDAAEVEEAVTPRTILISVMWANNEVGAVQPIAEIAKRKKALFHTDAAQAVGKTPVWIDGIDLMTFSAHKIHGPKGVGGLFLRKDTPMLPQIFGGGQEFEKRGGTENVPLIGGFAEAMDLAISHLDPNRNRMETLRKRLLTGFQNIPQMKIHGPTTDRLPNILNVSFAGVEGEAMILSLDAEGVYVSSGSACASLSMEPSHVLMAMGKSMAETRSSIRFSVAVDTEDREIEAALDNVPRVVERLRSISAAYPGEV